MDNTIKQLLIDRYEGSELVEFLQLTTEEVIDAFEETFDERLPDILELLGIEENADDIEQ